MKKILLIAILWISVNTLFAQEFEGIIVYSVESNDATISSMMSEMTYKLKGDKLTINYTMGGPQSGSMKVISLGEGKKVVTLMDMMGMKIATEIDPEQIKAEADKKKEDIKIEKTNETKTIAGYKCNKAIVTSKGQEPITIYFTKEITASPGNPEYPGLEGFPLEFYQTIESGKQIKLTAKSVTKQSIPDSEFVVPAGYQKMDLQQMMNGMNK